MDCVYYPDNFTANWTWKDPEQNFTNRFDLPLCFSYCKSDPPSIKGARNNWTQMVLKSVQILYTINQDFWIFNLQHWVGETFKYWCRGKRLFEVEQEGKGIKYKTAECKGYGTFEPWWSVSTLGGSCKRDLEGIKQIDQTFKVIQVYFMRQYLTCGSKTALSSSRWLFLFSYNCMQWTLLFWRHF